MKKFLNISLIVIFLFLIAIIYYKYYMVYSDGERSGKLNKFSLKGNVFKTYEAELLQSGSKAGSQGFQNNFFYFSIANDSLAKILMSSQGKMIRVHYVQYHATLPWRGDNYNGKNGDDGQYMVDKLLSVKDADF
jgi:hypothetical protein